MVSEIKVNTLSKNSGTDIFISNSLGLASFTTTERDALTSVAGDFIYNTTTHQAQFYNGSSWNRA